MQALKLLGQQLNKIWHQLDLNQKVVIVASGLAVLAGLGGLVVWSSRPNYGLLYGRLDPSEAGKIISELEEMKVPYQVGSSGSSIYVPQEKVHLARMQLATKGMPKNDGVGFEIFDKPAFGMSDFYQQANYTRALQTELARTIQEINGVESARVTIVKPENRLLLDPSKKAKAAVLVKLRGNTQLEPSAVNTIRYLVANSVEGLKPNDVSVSDNSGNMLSENDEEGSLSQLSSTQLAVRRNYESYFAKKVKSFLEKILGPDQVEVAVAAELNTETLTKTDEVYNNPKGSGSEPAKRTETIRKEDTDSSIPTPTGVPGTDTNANTSTNTPAFTNTRNKSIKDDKTIEYALSTSRTNIVRVAGDVKHLTASVFYNTNTNPNIDQTALRQAVVNALGLEPDTEAQRNTDVVLYGVGFNTKREVELGQQLEKERRTEFFWKTGKSVLYALLALAALLGFWRLVRNSTEELLPTGIPVGQLVGGQLVYETPVGVGGMPGMAMPGGAIATMAEGQRVEEVVAAGDEEVEELQAAKSKLVMDFGLGQAAPERITIEVLKQLIRENPAKMSQAARIWMTRKSQESEA